MNQKEIDYLKHAIADLWYYKARTNLTDQEQMDLYKKISEMKPE